MKNDRRSFLKMAAISGGSATMLPLAYSCSEPKPKISATDYSALDKVLHLPVLKKELFASPVIIEKIELLQDRKNFICRLTSKDGAVGISIGHPFIAQNSYPAFINILISFFTGKDARNLDELIYIVSESRVSKAEKFDSIDGVIKVPSGAGMGVIIDPAYINTHKVISV